MALIIIIIIILFLVLIGWIWTSLGNIENKTKIICIIVGVVSTYILTWIIYQIAKRGIIFENQEAKRILGNVFVTLFTNINGYFILPYTFRNIEKIDNEEIKKEQVRKSIIILLLVVIALLVFESIYLKNILHGIIRIK